jgi:glyoxylase-like metal-dependent hydrolase (beta-lactamase superfamily II)
MLEVKKFTFNPFSENTFIISNKSSKAVIIDPGCYYKAEQKELDDYISNNQLDVQCVLHTHSHLDHMFGTAHVVEKYNVKLWIHRDDKITYDSFEKICELYGIPIHKSPIQNPVFLNLHKPFQIDDITFQILFVPGHSPGHVAFYNKENNFVINGDCLFENSIGRTDLPGGDHALLIQSIKNNLFQLPNETIVYTGHGNETTIGREKKENPFLV